MIACFFSLFCLDLCVIKTTLSTSKLSKIKRTHTHTWQCHGFPVQTKQCSMSRHFICIHIVYSVYKCTTELRVYLCIDQTIKIPKKMMWEEAQQVCCNRMLMNLAMNKRYFFYIQTGYGKCRSLLHSFAFNDRVRRSMHSRNINRKVYNLFIHSGNLICWRFHKRFHHHIQFKWFFFGAQIFFLQKNSVK